MVVEVTTRVSPSLLPPGVTTPATVGRLIESPSSSIWPIRTETDWARLYGTTDSVRDTWRSDERVASAVSVPRYCEPDARNWFTTVGRFSTAPWSLEAY